MRRFALATALLLSTFAQAQIRMQVLRATQPLGEVVMTEKFTAAGKSVELKMDIKGPNGPVQVRRTASYSPTGAPIRKFMELTMGTEKQQAVATFAKDKANVTLISGGRRTVKDIPLAAGASIEDTSELWFRSVTPKVGATVRCFSFDLDRQEWVSLITAYSGKQKLQWAGKSIDVYRVVAKQGSKTVETLLDMKGDPVRIDDGTVQLIRIP